MSEPLPVSDFTAHLDKNINNAAKLLGSSPNRRAVFKAIYQGKKKEKSVEELACDTGLTSKQVLTYGGYLADAHLVIKDRSSGRMVYKKREDLKIHKTRILRMSGKTGRIGDDNTKVVVEHRIPKKLLDSLKTGTNIERVSIDDIRSFELVKDQKNRGWLPRTVSELAFKKGLASILGEPKVDHDWGGEKNDLFSTHLIFRGRKYTSAFALKGPGLNCKLIPARMGKNGDQIPRLMTSSAEIFFVQHWRDIDESVLEQLQVYALARSFTTKKTIYYGIIDGVDSFRLYNAYRKHFE